MQMRGVKRDRSAWSEDEEDEERVEKKTRPPAIIVENPIIIEDSPLETHKLYFTKV